MKRLWIGCLTGLLGLALAPAVHAQGYYRPSTSPFSRPALSPYLNLARPGPAGVNYYGLVRPQVETYSAIGQLQQQEQALRSAVLSGQDVNSPYPQTGHATRFGNYSHYYFSQGGSGTQAVSPFGGMNQQLSTPLTAPVAAVGTINPARPAPLAGPRPPRR